jgi:hypothetical protein
MNRSAGTLKNAASAFACALLFSRLRFSAKYAEKVLALKNPPVGPLWLMALCRFR